MHLLSRRFVRVPRIANLPSDDKPWLPTELLLLILSYVRERADLVTLCRVSKNFRDICRPLLYAVVSIKPSRETKTAHLRLYRAVHKASFSRIITDFSITLVNTALCSMLKPGRSSTRRDQCNCHKHNRDMGKAIQLLHGLHSLTIICHLCHGSHNHWHLLKLDPPMLREFTFSCYRSTAEPLWKPGGPRSILCAPFMSKITTLALGTTETRRYRSGWDGIEYAEIMRDTNILPRLNTLRHDGTEFFDFILSQRPVQRLCLSAHSFGVSDWNSKLDGGIRNTPGTLSHLFTYQLFHWLPLYMKAGIEPYCNLRFIGVITGTKSPEDDAFHEMEVLAPLSKLEFIEINRRRISPPCVSLTPVYLFTPSEHFLELLGHRHQLLRRVLLMGREVAPHIRSGGILWEKKGGAWESRPVPPLKFWDVVCDKLDEI